MERLRVERAHMEYYLLLPLFFMVAFLYSSVGHGGASGYLALFILLTAFERTSIVLVVLALNILAATLGLINYHRAGHFRWRYLLPFAVGSVPAAFIGGTVRLPTGAVDWVFGMTLLLAGLYMVLFRKGAERERNIAPRTLWLLGPPTGFGLGFVAGLVGIGGAVFLSPLLVYLGVRMKETSAVAAAFIVLNSLSGLAGYLLKGTLDMGLLLPALVAVGAGSFLGSTQGAFRFSPLLLRRLLGAVLLLAAFKLLYEGYRAVVGW